MAFIFTQVFANGDFSREGIPHDVVCSVLSVLLFSMDEIYFPISLSTIPLVLGSLMVTPVPRKQPWRVSVKSFCTELQQNSVHISRDVRFIPDDMHQTPWYRGYPAKMALSAMRKHGG